MIKTIEKLQMKEYYQGQAWMDKLNKLEAEGKMKSISQDSFQNVRHAFYLLYLYVKNNEEAMSKIVAYLNFRAGKKEFLHPYENTLCYWIKVNGLNMTFTLLNEYCGGGVEENEITIGSLDTNGTDEFWIGIAHELLGVGEGKMENKEGFRYKEWSSLD